MFAHFFWGPKEELFGLCASTELNFGARRGLYRTLSLVDRHHRNPIVRVQKAIRPWSSFIFWTDISRVRPRSCTGTGFVEKYCPCKGTPVTSVCLWACFVSMFPKHLEVFNISPNVSQLPPPMAKRFPVDFLVKPQQKDTPWRHN